MLSTSWAVPFGRPEILAQQQQQKGLRVQPEGLRAQPVLIVQQGLLVQQVLMVQQA
jgi:hypothetical protein